MNVIPSKYKELNLNEIIDTYFAMARGYQGNLGDVSSFGMKKWFNTNYHYIVPEIYDDTKIKLIGEKPFLEYQEAKDLGIETKPVIIGAFTFLKLAKYKGEKNFKDYIDDLVDAYGTILSKFDSIGVKLIQIDEPILVTDLSEDDVKIFTEIMK